MSLNLDKEASKSHLGAAGWRMGDFYHSNLSDSHFIYVCDYRNNQTKLFSILKSDLQESEFHKLIPIGDLVSLIATLMIQTSGKQLTDRENSTLTAALIGYIKSTQTYSKWLQVSNKNDQMHFLLNIYPDQAYIERLRPVILRSDTNTVIDVSQIQTQSRELREIDMKKHPEWFPKAKERRR